MNIFYSSSLIWPIHSGFEYSFSSCRINLLNTLLFSNMFFFYIKLMLLFKQECMKLIKIKSEEVMLQMISVSNKCCSFELSIHHKILKKIIMVSRKELNGTHVFNIKMINRN